MGSSSMAVPCANGLRKERRLSLAIACNNFAHPTIPNNAEKNAELNAPIKMKYGEIFI